MTEVLRPRRDKNSSGAKAASVVGGDGDADAEAQALLETTRAAQHPNCLVCGEQNGLGLQLDFKAIAPGSVGCVFNCRSVLQSYPHTLHGGITATLLDAAMTNCLFSLGVVAVTAELTVRFVSPIKIDRRIEIRAALESHDSPLYLLAAEVKQDGYLVARAKAKFFKLT